MTKERALVLGGGGSTGNAWLIGVVAGLADAGLDVATADLTIGTSAGATAAAQLGGGHAEELFAAIGAAPQPSTPFTRPSPSATSARSAGGQMDRIMKVIASAENVADYRRRIGAEALKAEAVSDASWQTQWRTTVASRLPSQDWPERGLVITAVDASTGDSMTFDRQSNVDLADAVAASCSVRIPYQVGESRYIDGGYRSNADNADLAMGYRRVLVLSPLGGRSLTPVEWGQHLVTQVDDLRASGGKVEVIFPDDEAAHLFGANAMDLSLRPAAAQVGFA